MSDALSEFPPVAPALGSSVVGLCVSFLSYGIMLCQALRYFQRYWKTDSWDLKAAVVGIILGETVHSGLYAHIGYYYLVVTYGHPEAMSKSVISLTLVTPIVTLCIIICQFIYVRRAYLFLPHKFRIALALFVTATVLVGLGFACAFTGKLFLDGSFAAFLQYRWLLSVAFAVSAFLDVFIASILSASLYISRTGIRRTDALVQTLILYAFTTGALTSVTSVGCLVVDLTEGHHTFIIPVALVTAKVYANAVLLTLNLRHSLHGMLSDTHDGTELVGMSGGKTIQREGNGRDPRLRAVASKNTMEFKIPTHLQSDISNSTVDV